MRRKLTLTDKLVRIPYVKNPLRSLMGRIASIGFLRKVLRKAIRRNLVSQRIWKYFPIYGEFDVKLPAGELFRYSSAYGDGVGTALYWQGAEWLGGEFVVFYRLAAKSDLVLDIGANTGIFSLIACAANPTAKVIAFEPVPAIYERLVANIGTNSLENRCRALPHAASDRTGTGQLFVPWGRIPLEATLDAPEIYDSHGQLTEITITTVDSVCGDQRVDLAKIDVEGTEHRVLSGMKTVLARWRPALVLEHHANSSSPELETVLSGFGYRFFAIEPGGGLTRVQGFQGGVRQHFLCEADRTDIRRS